MSHRVLFQHPHCQPCQCRQKSGTSRRSTSITLILLLYVSATYNFPSAHATSKRDAAAAHLARCHPHRRSRTMCLSAPRVFARFLVHRTAPSAPCSLRCRQRTNAYRPKSARSAEQTKRILHRTARSAAAAHPRYLRARCRRTASMSLLIERHLPNLMHARHRDVRDRYRAAKVPTGSRATLYAACVALSPHRD